MSPSDEFACYASGLEGLSLSGQCSQAKAQRTPPAAQINAIINKVNTMLRANYSQFADGIIDFAADSRLSNPNDTTYFYTDKTHLNNTGYQVVADLIVAAVSPLL